MFKLRDSSPTLSTFAGEEATQLYKIKFAALKNAYETNLLQLHIACLCSTITAFDLSISNTATMTSDEFCALLPWISDISTKVQSHAVLMSNIMSFQSYLANPSKSCPRPASPASPASPDSPGSSLAAPTASGSIGKRPPMTVEAMKIRISELKKELISKSPHTPRTTQGIKRLPPGFKRVNAKNGRRGIVNGNRNHSHTSKVSNDLLVPTTVPLTPSVVHANANAALALLAQNSRALKRTRTEV